MKYTAIIGGMMLLAAGCLPEKYKGDDCRRQFQFVMNDVPYAFVNEEAIGWRPYYTFVEQLDLYVFKGEKIGQTAKYTFDYCREHPVIPFAVDYDEQTSLWVVNLYDSRELDWRFDRGRLQARFSILNYEEPPVLLAAISPIDWNRDSIAVDLRMLVSRLEIRLTNPPSSLSGLDVTVRNVAASVTTDFVLGDTTHIQKYLFFDAQQAGEYNFGVNTFPTYPDQAALVSIFPIGTSGVAPILVEDERLHLLPGVVTRLELIFDAEGKIDIKVEVDGKWEIDDGGHIII